MVAEGAVRLVPNAGNFHTQARSDIKKGGQINAPVTLQPDTRGFRANANERLKSMPPIVHKVQLKADATGFKRDAQAKLSATTSLNVTAKIKAAVDNASVTTAIDRIKARLATTTFNVNIGVGNSAQFMSQIAWLTRRRSLNIDVDSPDLALLQAQLLLLQVNLRGTGMAARNAGRGFRAMGASAYAALIAVAALGLVSLVPLIGQLVQAAGVIALLPAMAGAAAAAIGAIGIGMTGVFKTFGAMKKQAAAVDNINTLTSAQKRLTQAEKGLRKAQADSLRGQQRLNEERRLAVRRLRDVNDELQMSAFDENAARFAVERARRAIGEAYAEGDALDVSEARNNYDIAVEQLDQMVKKNADLKDDVEAANKAGIEGDKQVVAAKEDIIASEEAIADAMDNVADAQDGITDSINKSTAAVDEFEQALADLSPNAQDFVLKVQSLGGAWKELRMEVQDALFFNMGDEVVELANVYLPILKTGFAGVATEINGGIIGFFDRLKTENAQNNFAIIFENARLAIQPMMDGLTSLSEALGNIAAVGSTFLPGIAEDFKTSMDSFAEWSGSEEGQNKIRSFIEESMKTLGEIWDWAKAFGRVLGGLFGTSDEVGESMVKNMTDSMNKFADWMEKPEGQESMSNWWETVQQTISDLMSMIGQAMILADKFLKLAKAFGLLDEPEPPPGATSEDNSTFHKGGSTFKNKHGQDVDKDGNVLIGKGFINPGAREGSFFGTLFDWLGGDDGSGGYRAPEDRQNVENSVNSGPKFLPGMNDTIDVRTPHGRGASTKTWSKAEWLKTFEPGTQAAAEAAAKFDEIWATQNENTETKVEEQKGFFGGLGGKIGNVFSKVTGDDFPGFMTGLGSAAQSVFGFGDDSNTKFGDFENNTTSIFGRIVGTVFPGFETGLDKVLGFAGTVVEKFKSVWATLKAYAAEPINWVIREVINGALKSAWDTLEGILPGLPKWDGVSEIKVDNDGSGKAEGGMTPTPKFFKGGVLPGYTPGRDPLTIGVSGGEAVMRPEWTRAMGKDHIDEMNGVARREGVLGVKKRMGYYSNGGIVDAMASIMNEKYPMLELTSGYRTTDNGYHSKGMAADFSNGGIEGTPEMKSASQWWYENFQPDLRELIHMPFNNNVKDGQNVGNGMGLYGEPTMLDHRHHLHVATDKVLGADGTSSPAEPGFLDRVKNAIGDTVQAGRNRLAGLANRAIATPFDAVLKNLPDFGPSSLAAVPRETISGVRNALMEKVSGFIGAGGSSADAGNTPWDLGAGVEQWRGKVIEALQREGFDAGIRNQNLMLAQIGSESSGNPNAIQQVIDVNSGGNEAVGLLQVIPGTFAANRNPSLPNDRTNPDASMSAALRYYRATYGTDLGVMWGQNHGYHEGGLAGEGQGFIKKTALEPERVLSPRQTQAFEMLIPMLSNMFGLNASQGPFNKPVDINIATLDGKEFPTTANTEGVKDPITGAIHGQDLQGAAIDPLTGEYLPERNTTSNPVITPMEKAKPFSQTIEGKTAMSIASTFGFGKQAQMLAGKEDAVMKLMGGISGASAALAGGPEAFAAHLASTQAAAVGNISKNFSEYAAESSGGMLESALSALAGPLAGATINTGVSKGQLMEVVEDAQSRQARRYRRKR